MQFRLDRFYRINRRALIWAAIIGLLYILRDFFALIFATFLFVSFTLPVANYFQHHTRIARKWIIVGMYLVIFTGFIGLMRYVVPQVTAEAFNAGVELYSMGNKVAEMKNDLELHYPTIKPVTQSLTQEEIDEYLTTAQEKVRPVLVHSAAIAFAAITTILLGMLFSFLIVLDLSRLTVEVQRIERSRLHDFYQETALPVVKFASVLAQAFRAQGMIAITNSLLTLIGFLILGLPKLSLLTIIVFVFSFIPVLGVFISTTPAVLVAINYCGYGRAVWVIVLVTIVHLIEAYILNPLIYGHQMKLNPVLVLIILFVGHHFFGVWGMVLGVPVTYYFLYYVFNIPREDSQQLVTEKGPEPALAQPQQPDKPSA